MTRFLLTVIVGFALGVSCERFFPEWTGGHAPTPSPQGGGGKRSMAFVASAPNSPLSQSLQAETNKNYDDALKQVAAYQQSGGDPFIASLRAGWLYYLKGAYAEAEQSYATANRLHPGALNPVLGLLNVAEAMKDQTRIQRTAEAVLRVDPSNYRACMIIAARDYADHDYRGAGYIYRRLLNIYPDDVDVRSGLAWADYYTGDSHDALAQFQAILKTYPEYPYAKQGYNLVARVNGAASTPR
jgi:tetratricopeptide (TPR) repeat protein